MLSAGKGGGGRKGGGEGGREGRKIRMEEEKKVKRRVKKTFMWLCGCQINISNGGTLQLKEV